MKIKQGQLFINGKPLEISYTLGIQNKGAEIFYDCKHGYLFGIPEFNIIQAKCTLREDCLCYGCQDFSPKEKEDNQ